MRLNELINFFYSIIVIKMISYLTKTIKCNIFVLYLDKFYISSVIRVTKLAFLKSRLKKIKFYNKK
jgi:hypothetical protein